MSQEEGESNEEEKNKTEIKIKSFIIPDKPLSADLAASCLSLLTRLGYGFSHAFIKFSCVNKGITDIDILVKFRFLRYVFLSHNHISDLSPIFAAEYLMYLKADHNRIVKPGTPKGLQYLQFFDLSRNKLTCTDYINHGRLKHLILNYNEITTLKGVDGPPLNQFKLRSLETLELRGNKVTSCEGLNNLHDLKTLYFSENLLRSIEDLSQMTGLTRLHLRDNDIRYLDGFLQGPPNLQYLNLRYINRTYIHLSSQMVAANDTFSYNYSLTLRGNQIKRWLEVRNLLSLSSLKILILSDNPIADRDQYRPMVLGMLPHLQRLDKDKTTPEEVSESVAFYEKLDDQILQDDEEEEEEVAKRDERMPEDRFDEMMEETEADKGGTEANEEGAVSENIEEEES